MRRIAIIGNAGGGKTRLARQLGKTIALPVFEFDHLEWQPNWTPTPQSVVHARHAEWLAEPGWIIDGWGNAHQLEARFASADTIVVVDRAFLIHVAWMIKRFVAAKLRLTSDWPPRGCPPKLAIVPNLLRMMWTVRRTVLPALLIALNAEPFRGRVVHLRSARDIRNWQQECVNGYGAERRDFGVTHGRS